MIVLQTQRKRLDFIYLVLFIKQEGYKFIPSLIVKTRGEMLIYIHFLKRFLAGNTTILMDFSQKTLTKSTSGTGTYPAIQVSPLQSVNR